MKDLESLLAELQEAIEQLADANAPLDQLVRTYERAAALVKAAEQRLEELKRRAAALETPVGS